MDDALRKRIDEAIRKQICKEAEIVSRQIKMLRQNTNRLEAEMKRIRKRLSK